jgi:hypothetical protein
MSECRQCYPEKILCRIVPRGIRAGFGQACALVLLLSIAGCQSPGSATPPVNESAAEDKEHAVIACNLIAGFGFPALAGLLAYEWN